MIRYFGFRGRNKVPTSEYIEEEFKTQFPEIDMDKYYEELQSKYIFFVREGDISLCFTTDNPLLTNGSSIYQLVSSQLLVKVEIKGILVLVEISRDFRTIYNLYKLKRDGTKISGSYYFKRGSSKIGNESISLNEVKRIIRRHYEKGGELVYE